MIDRETRLEEVAFTKFQRIGILRLCLYKAVGNAAGSDFPWDVCYYWKSWSLPFLYSPMGDIVSGFGPVGQRYGFLHQPSWISSCSHAGQESSAFCRSLLTFCGQWSLHHTYFVTTLTIHRQSASVVPLHLPNLLRPLLFSVDFLSMSLNTSVRYLLFYVFSSYLPLTPYSNISIFRDILGYLDILDLWLDFFRAPQT